MSSVADSSPAGRAAFRYPAFKLFALARFFSVAAIEMQSVAVGWQVYEITSRPLDLGLVSLAQFLPGILLFLVAGYVADRYERRKVLMFGYAGLALSSGLLAWIAQNRPHAVHPIYAVMLLVGVVRSLMSPAGRSIVPLLVAEEHLQNAVAWNATVFQAATILGPALGGLAYTFLRGPAVYAIAAATSLGGAMAMLSMRPRSQRLSGERASWTTTLAGLRYIWRRKLIRGSISLDLFAMLLGGAVALLPVYARDVLTAGPWALGLLRCAPGIGASTMAILLAYRPLRRRVGRTMLWCVAGFGAFTILFGISRNLTLSLVALALVGAADTVSVVIRAVLIQVATPDEMRGRVTAVEMIFIGASNELGGFESGVTAQWFGAVPAVILGGVGALVVTAVWAWAFPELRNADEFTPPHE